MSRRTASGRKAIVLAVDGLRAGFLGPYGNTWVETPLFNRLASCSLTLDDAMADTSDFELGLRSFFTGQHAFPSRASASPLSLVDQLEQADGNSVLVTDHRGCAESPWTKSFTEAYVIEGDSNAAASDLSAMGFARLVVEVLELLDTRVPDLLWIQSRGMHGPWDAPYAFREQFRDDEDDPEPPRSVEPPCFVVGADDDPDSLQAWQWAYAGQVAALDHCLEPLLQLVLEEFRHRDEELLFILTGNRGYPLGEHGRVGSSANRLLSEWIHVPCFIFSSAHPPQAIRSSQIVQPHYLHATLRDWLNLSPGPREKGRSLLGCLDDSRWSSDEFGLSVNEFSWALRTPPWLASGPAPQLHSGSECEWQLYLKPDDRWDSHNVADRGSETLAAFHQLWEQLQLLPPSATWDQLPPFGEVLHRPLA